MERILRQEPQLVCHRDTIKLRERVKQNPKGQAINGWLATPFSQFPVPCTIQTDLPRTEGHRGRERDKRDDEDNGGNDNVDRSSKVTSCVRSLLARDNDSSSLALLRRLGRELWSPTTMGNN